MNQPASLDPVKFKEAIEAMAARGIVLPAIYYGVLPVSIRAYAFSVAGLASIAQLQQVLDSLTDAINNGESFSTWAMKVKQNKTAIASLPAHRLDNIFRTNIMQAYNQGREQHAIQHRATRPYILIDAINDSRVRRTHLAYDGMVTEIDSPKYFAWQSRDKYRCRCTFITLSTRQAEKYMQEDAENMAKNPELNIERANATAEWNGEQRKGEPLRQTALKISGNGFDSFLQQLKLL